MALDTRSRPQQHQMHYIPHDSVTPQFTNPWSSQEQLNDAATNLHALSRPTIRTTMGGVSSPGRTVLAPSGHYQNPPGLMQNVPYVSLPAFTSTDLAIACSTTSSPTSNPTSAAAFAPPFASGPFDLTPPRSIIPTDRRLSQPAMPSSIFLNSDLVSKPRQASLTDVSYRPPRPEMEFTSGGGMMMEQQQQQLHQQQQQLQHQQQQLQLSRSRHDSSSSMYQTPLSTNSSISTTHSFPYYNGGSVDSTATDYSDNSGYPRERAGSLRHNSIHHHHHPSKSSNYLHTSIAVPNQMMTTFSSKISSTTQKKHKCKVCEKRFTRPSSLQTHTYSHTGEKPFACEQDGCGRRFSVVSNLRRHKKVHQIKKIASEL